MSMHVTRFLLIGWFSFLSAFFAPTVAGAPIEGLVAPPLARTASTVLLLWDRPSDSVQVQIYEVLCDDRLVGRSEKLNFTLTQLAASHRYRVAVRGLTAAGAVTMASNAIEVETRAAGSVSNVRDSGARGDGETDDTVALQRVIDDCPAGGTVLIPRGDYAVNHLRLKGNLTLRLEAGATLRFLGREVSQPIREKVPVRGLGGMTNADCGALLTAIHADNLTITGEGIIDGNGPTWWQHLQDYRPRLFQIVASKNVFVQDITLQDPPKFNTLLSYVDHAVFSGVTFVKRSTLPSLNGDGLDPDSSTHILIVGCKFGNQDDSIAIKAGTVDEGATVRPGPSEHIVIRDCRFDGHLAPGSHPLGIAIGSGASGGVRDVLIKDCDFIDAGSLANFRINRSSRYGLVEDVRVESCTYTNSVFPDEPWNRAPISLDLFYYGRKDDDPDVAQPVQPGTPTFRDLHFKNITINNPKGRAIYVSGLAEKPLSDVTFSDIVARSKIGFFARNVDNITLDRVSLTAESGAAIEWGGHVTKRQVSADSK